MNLASIGDIFEIVILIIVFVGPALLKLFGSEKKQFENAQKDAPVEEYTSSQEDLDAWLQSLNTPKPAAVKKEQPRKKAVAKRGASKRAKPATVAKAVTPPPLKKGAPELAQVQLPPELHEPDAAPTAKKRSTAKKAAARRRSHKGQTTTLRTLLRGQSRRNAILVGEILGKPHALK